MQIGIDCSEWVSATFSNQFIPWVAIDFIVRSIAQAAYANIPGCLHAMLWAKWWHNYAKWCSHIVHSKCSGIAIFRVFSPINSKVNSLNHELISFLFCKNIKLKQNDLEHPHHGLATHGDNSTAIVEVNCIAPSMSSVVSETEPKKMHQIQNKSISFLHLQIVCAR